MRAFRSLDGCLFVLLLLGASCSRDSKAVLLTAPFNDETEVGEVTATWKATGKDRAFADATRLEEPEVELQYRVDLRNDLKEPAFVRLAGFQLLSRDGLAVGRDDRKVECSLAPGKTQGVLAGSVWVAKRNADQVEAFTIERFSVPLSERARALYGEWLLQSRPGQEKAIEAELGGYAAAPPCTAPGAANP
jgi:hypothetical protein